MDNKVTKEVKWFRDMNHNWNVEAGYLLNLIIHLPLLAAYQIHPTQNPHLLPSILSYTMLRTSHSYYSPGYLHLPHYYTQPIVPYIAHTHVHHVENEQHETDRLRIERDQWFKVARELKEDLTKVEGMAADGRKKVELLEREIRGT